MACSVALANSPVFSPSSSLFCKTSVSSPDTLTRHHHVSSPSSPSSPFRIRLPKPLTGLRPCKEGPASSSSSASASPPTVLKRKRPARLDIPIASLIVPASVPLGEGYREMLEDERDGYYSVYCKKGRREAMEDRYSAVVDLQGGSKQVLRNLIFFFPLA